VLLLSAVISGSWGLAGEQWDLLCLHQELKWMHDFSFSNWNCAYQK
jgi:hypothetical protein